MPDWDTESTRLDGNVSRILLELASDARERPEPGVEWARNWQRRLMDGLDVPSPRYVGRFRGEEGMTGVEVRVGKNPGVNSAEVTKALGEFETRLRDLIAFLDAEIPTGREPTLDQFHAVMDVCAWTHAEWIRIHPFANGNGRTARLWVNAIALRYNLPPFVRIRPRPSGNYGAAGAAAMRENWKPTVRVLLDMYADWISRHC